MFPNRRHKPKFIFPLLFVVFVFAAGALVMLLWNAILPDLVHVEKITYWKAVGLLILCKILFGFGFRGRGNHPTNNWRQRFQNMSTEEKQRLKEEWKERFKRRGNC